MHSRISRIQNIVCTVTIYPYIYQHAELYVKMKSTSNIKTSLTREDWVNAATQVLYESGIGSVSIVQLAKSLGVTRGSFYHHFTDREDLYRMMLKYWEKTLTIAVRDEVRGLDLPPAESLRALIRSIHDHKAAVYDAAFRAWALHDPLARTALERIDKFRLEYITKLIEAAGFKGIDADNRARLLLYYEMSSPAFFAKPNPETKDQLNDVRLRLLLQ